jgi:multidrug transporter EmrE-like cation transporter
MTTPVVSIFYFIVAAFIGALGQYMYKSGADLAIGGLMSFINPRIILGIICYIAVMVLFIAAFKRGGSMSVLYPIYASTFIWGAIISWLVYHEPIRPVNIAGMIALVAGMWLMGIGRTP